MKKVSTIAGSAILASVLAIAPLAAFAQTTVVDGGVAVTAVGANATVSAKASASLAKGIARADQEITRRITNLNSLSTRIGSMKNLSATEISSLQSGISTEISTLTTLKATIDAETVEANLKTDIQSITKDYRVYMLVLPQGRIAAATDRIATLVSDMQQISVKLSARISTAQAAGVNVTAAQSAYTDMQAKVADASTQSQAALAETQNLAPDQGVASVEASNTAAIKDAAAKIKTAAADLKAARADITTIMGVVKGHDSATASASAGVNAQ